MPVTIAKMIEADPNFVLGRVLSVGLDLIGTGTTIRHDLKLRSDLEVLKKLAELRKSEIDWRELTYVDAIDQFANGNMAGSAQVCEQILAKYPNDMLALKFAHDIYFYLGDKVNILDSIEKVYPKWENNNQPLQPYIHGMYAFALEERRQYQKAENQAKLGLKKLPNDAWAVHALAHVHTMQYRIDEGIKAIGSTRNDWYDCNYLACHNFWHWSLFHIEQGEPEAALSLYESEIGTRAIKSGAMLDIVDAASLLYRLDLLSLGNIIPDIIKCKRRWQELYQICEPHFQDHVLGFNITHFTMSCLGSDRIPKAEELLEELKVVKSTGIIMDHWAAVTEQVLESMIDFKREKYQSTVNRLLSVKADIVKMGGSDAQRDVFNQLLIVAALKAKNIDLCRTLIDERQNIQGNCILVREINKALEQC